VKNRDYDGGMATSIDQKNFVKTALRLPPELHTAVHEAAQKSSRSYNAELLERIQSSFDGERSQEVVLDQATQIWELRCRLAATNMALLTALLTIEHGGEADEEIVLGLKRLMQRNAPFISSLMDEATLKLVSQISVEDEMQEIREQLAKQKAGKPKA
jgi:hypothetical protein